MIEELQFLLPSFPGRRAHIRCYAHTINLTAKGVLRPFEPKKPKKNDKNGDRDGDEADDIEREELEAELKDLEENGVQDDDDDDGFVDVVAAMSEEERDEWEVAVTPVRNALTKVRVYSTNSIIAIFGNFNDWLGNLYFSIGSHSLLDSPRGIQGY